MVPFIARHCIVPFHERLLRRRTIPCLRELMQTQWMSPDELRNLQQQKLKNLLTHAMTRVPYYRQRLRPKDLDLDGNPLQSLPAIPLLAKDDIRTSLGQLVWPDAPGGVFRSETGGSTGEPLTFYVDRRRQAYDQASRIRSQRWFGFEYGDRELYLWGSPVEKQRTGHIKRIRDVLFNHRLLSAFNMSPARMDQYVDAFNRFRPGALFGYPSSIALFIDHVRRAGKRLRTRQLRGVFVTGEVLDNQVRKSLESFFEVPVANGYGSREAGFIAHECPDGGMHITAENVLLEIVDRDGQPVDESRHGEIVLTHLDAYAMPMIRYRTGDIGRHRSGRCRCGRGLPLLDIVNGRATDFVYRPDGTIMHGLAVICPLRETPAIRQFRVIQHADYSVTVEIVVGTQNLRIDRLRQRLIRVLGQSIPLQIRILDEIRAAASGKHQCVISYAAPRAGSPSFPAVEAGT